MLVGRGWDVSGDVVSWRAERELRRESGTLSVCACLNSPRPSLSLVLLGTYCWNYWTLLNSMSLANKYCCPVLIPTITYYTHCCPLSISNNVIRTNWKGSCICTETLNISPTQSTHRFPIIILSLFLFSTWATLTFYCALLSAPSLSKPTMLTP